MYSNKAFYSNFLLLSYRDAHGRQVKNFNQVFGFRHQENLSYVKMRYMFRLRRYVWIFFTVLCTSSCEFTNEKTSSEFMVDLLEKVAKEASHHTNPYMHELRIAHYDSVMQMALDSERRLYGQYQKGLNQLYAGKSEAAIQTFEALKTKMPTYQALLGSRYEGMMDMLKSYIAISHLRWGEQQNCILNHTAASCIIPISPAGYHEWTHGSEKAIEMYQQILRDKPDALDAIWLMNIGYMTLGGYPNQVPDQWRIPPEKFVSDYPLKPFPDIAMNLGLDVKALSGGSIVEDFNGDGLLDVMITSWGLRDQMQYFQNNGDGTFTEQTQKAGLIGIVSGLNMVHADYDNNGYADVFVLRGAWLNKHGLHPNSLLKNLGPDASGVPQFVDVTRDAGLLSFYPTQTANWNDFNLDGWVDLFIGNETNPYQEDQHYPTELYLNNQDGTFREAAQIAGIQITEYVKGVASGDYDLDGDADMYLSTLESYNLLFENKGYDESGVPTFEEVTESVGIKEDISTFPTWFWDYNNDGWLDLFVSGYNRGGSGSIAYDVAAEYLDKPFEADMPRLYRNKGDGTFQDVTREVGLFTILHTMGSNFGDLDNDGYLDMYLGTGDPDFRSIVPNRMFRNNMGKDFQDVTTAGGFGNLQKGHGVSFADIDNDGDQDIYIVMGGANYGDTYQNLLFHNPYNDDSLRNHWISIDFEGVDSNKSAIGTQVKIYVKSGEETRMIYREVNSGGSFGGNPFRLEVGLGNSTEIIKMEVFWPASSIRQVFEDIQADQFLHIAENDTVVRIQPKLQPNLTGAEAPAFHTHQ